MSNRSAANRDKRARDLKRRIASSAYDHLPRCVVPDPLTGKVCGRPTGRAARRSLSLTTCIRHQRQFETHGSLWSKSPTAKMLRPYLTTAAIYIRSHHDDIYINAALTGLRSLMDSAGDVVIATRLRGLSAARRGQIAFARLKEKGVSPDRLLAAALAMSAFVSDAAAIVPSSKEYLIVGIGKYAHRISKPGYHNSWATHDATGRPITIVVHKRVRAAGGILRKLGEPIWREAELVIAYHGAAVLLQKQRRYGAHQSNISSQFTFPSSDGNSHHG